MSPSVLKKDLRHVGKASVHRSGHEEKLEQRSQSRIPVHGPKAFRCMSASSGSGTMLFWGRSKGREAAVGKPWARRALAPNGFKHPSLKLKPHSLERHILFLKDLIQCLQQLFGESWMGSVKHPTIREAPNLR